VRKFEEIVDVVLAQIKDGTLKPGDRLRPHRQIAYEFNCSIGTASRAYAELERRGITYGKVGQGTFVYGTDRDEEQIGKGFFFPRESWIDADSSLIDLSKNSYFNANTDGRLREVFQKLSHHNESGRYLDYFDSRGRINDREIAANWLRYQLDVVDSSNIIVIPGVQSGLYLAMATLASPGDIVATEEFGYPGIRAVCRELDLRIAAVAMDEHGLLPEAFEQLCQRGNVKILVTIPTNHNPTGTTQPTARRMQILKIAQKHHVHIVEDAVYAPLQPHRVPSYCQLAPDDTLYLTGLSKAFSPGLRVGYMVAPAPLIPRLASKMTAVNWMTSPVSLDMANYFLISGLVDKQVSELIAACRHRETLARQILGKWLVDQSTNLDAPLAHFWLRVPDEIEVSDFVQEARAANIVVVGSEAFAMSKSVENRHVRICVMAEPDEQRLQKALTRLAAILTHYEEGGPSVYRTGSSDPGRVTILP
jgi:DNA-binding transcriptional MocR family regulator